MRTFSAWVKSVGAPEFIITVETADGQVRRRRPLRYQWTGNPTVAPYHWTSASPPVPLFGCNAVADGAWHRIERHLEADLASAYPGETLLRVLGMTVHAYTEDLYIDDVRFSNAVTVEHNTLGPGVIGHVLRHTTTDPATYARAHRWFHFDQVGSVLAATDASGAVALRHDQDAFGNALSSWQTGLVGGHRPGWHHNTKEWDGDVDLVYMYQRWYMPETGGFIERAPYPPFMEHAFVFVESSPVEHVDPNGELRIGWMVDVFQACITDPIEQAGRFVRDTSNALGSVNPGATTPSSNRSQFVFFANTAIDNAENLAMLAAVPAGAGARIGGSGKPVSNTVKHSSRKRALDAAQANSAKGRAPIHHRANSTTGAPRHYHPADCNGQPLPVHHDY
jgi:RHS repeat-associated protein